MINHIRNLKQNYIFNKSYFIVTYNVHSFKKENKQMKDKMAYT